MQADRELCNLVLIVSACHPLLLYYGINEGADLTSNKPVHAISMMYDWQYLIGNQCDALLFACGQLPTQRW